MSKTLETKIDSLEAYNDNVSDNQLTSVVARNPKKTWRSYIWDSLDKSPEERRFLLKLDAGLLSIVCLGYFIKYLDQANLNNAFVSGMKEDLGMNGDQLNYVQTTWTVGYLLGEIPSNILLTRIRPSIWLPALEIIWSVLTMCMSRCNNVSQLYALRFFIGLAESGFYPGVLYVMGSCVWSYRLISNGDILADRKDELAKRASIFNISGGIATMFSGYLMSAVTGLAGRNGIQGWKWLFVMDGIISLPVALASFFVFPDVPSNTRAWYINENDKVIAKTRVLFEGRPQRQPYTKAKVRKIFKSWHIYLLPLVFLFAGAAAAGTAQPIFALYLKASKHPKYTIAQINNYPTATSAVGIVSTLIYAWISDSVLSGRRWPLLVLASVVNLITFGSLAVWNIPGGWRWACYIISGQVSSISPMALAWGNEICFDDEEERAIVVAAMNDSVYIVGIWLTLIVWQQVDAPRYHNGFITASAFSVASIVLVLVVRALSKRELLRKKGRGGEVTEIDSTQMSDVRAPGQEKLI